MCKRIKPVQKHGSLYYDVLNVIFKLSTSIWRNTFVNVDRRCTEPGAEHPNETSQLFAPEAFPYLNLFYGHGDMLQLSEMPMILSGGDGTETFQGKDAIVNGNHKFYPHRPPPLETAINGYTIAPGYDNHYSLSPQTSFPSTGISNASPLINSYVTQIPAKGVDSNLRVPNSRHRRSSPARFSNPSNSLTSPATELHQKPTTPRLQHRHTLEVPRASAHRISREYPTPGSANSEDAHLTNGHISPGTQKNRRSSFTLGRRLTRSVHSDIHLDEVQQDEDATRWADVIRQKRASRRRRKEDEDDDRVVVGTKVDQHHVNWVMAYNMLTGIRFTVSRTNAKLDRELTEADFQARHKFSFDM